MLSSLDSGSTSEHKIEDVTSSGLEIRQPPRLRGPLGLEDWKMEICEAVSLLKEAIHHACKGHELPPILTDEIMYKFAACRNFDMQSAAQRYLRFMKLFQEYSLSFDETPEITKGQEMKIIQSGKYDLSGRPLIIIVARHLDWQKISPSEMQKTWFFSVWHALCSSPLAQTQGLVLMLITNGIHPSMFKREFHGFVAKAVQECLPVKIFKIFVLNQPWFFSSVIWPLVSQLLSSKLRQRVVMVGRKYELMSEFVDVQSIPPAFLSPSLPDEDAPDK